MSMKENTTATGHIPAKPCYEHLGGKLGDLLMQRFIELGWMERNGPAERHYHLTPEGENGFGKLGVDLSRIKRE